ncbi:MAG: phage scaffolding protein [Clostridiales bacterium]|nr:phage scaffolding protein [Clostridiales bacterium]
MELRELLGEELFSQVDAKIQEHNSGEPDKLKHVRYADLSEGNYVSKEKYTSLQTEANGYKTQLGEANTTIQSYKDMDMDIDGIRQSAKDWETKYTTDMQALQQTLENERMMHAAEQFLSGQKIKSPLSRKAILQDFMAQKLEFKDGKFTGADEYMKRVREQYPDEFEKESEKPDKPFVRTTKSGSGRTNPVSDEAAYIQQKYGKNKYCTVKE